MMEAPVLTQAPSDPQAHATTMVRNVVDGLKAVTLENNPDALPGHREVGAMIARGESVPFLNL